MPMASPSIELSMIVKNGAATLPRCLQSVAPCVDRMLVGDTGSSDASPEVCRALGAEVVRLPWEDDFARARNRLLALATCDWVLVLDADEMLGGDAPAPVREAVARRNIFGYDVWRWNYVREAHSRGGEQAPIPNPGAVEASRPYPAYVPTLNTRLFRRHPGVYWEHCVHETVSGRLEQLGLARARAGFIIHHFGQAEDADEVRRSKNDLYLELGLRKVQSNPDDARACFELGLAELEHRRRPAAALAWFERACALEPTRAAAWLFAGVCRDRLGRPGEAMEKLRAARELGLDTPVLHEAMGDAHLHLAEYEAARAAYERASGSGGVSPLNDAKLGATEVCLGLAEQGIGRMKQAVARSPRFAELYDILVAGALFGGDVRLAAEAAQARLEVGQPEERHFQIAAELRAALAKGAKVPAPAAMARAQADRPWDPSALPRLD